VTSDPILQGLGLQDADLHTRVVDVLLELALSSPRREPAPTSGPTRDLGVSLAWYDGMSASHVLKLTRSADSCVRLALANRRNCPPEALMLLAADADQWVRRGVFENAAATDEVRAAVTLQSSSVEVANWIAWRGSAPTGPEGPEEGGLPRADIVDLTDLPATSTDRMAVWNAGRRSLWPSTAAFLHPATPEWILEAFSEHGHPAALFDSRLSVPRREVIVDAGRALRELVDSRLLIRAVWRGLAIWGALELFFIPNYEGWPQLIPLVDGKPLLEPGSAAELVISGGETGRMALTHAEEWVLVSHSVSLASAIDILGEVFDLWVEYGIDDETFVSLFEDPDIFGDSDRSHQRVSTLDRFALAGLSYLQRHRGIEIATETAMEAIRALDVFPMLSEPRDLSGYEFQVVIGGTDLPWISYSESGPEKMRLLAELLRESEKDLAVSEWGVGRHFLECMALHPSTPDEVRALCTARD